MISVEIEFTTKTVLGLTEGQCRRCEYSDYSGRMDEMVKWIKKAISNENIRRPMITFSYYNDARTRDIGTARIIGEWCNQYDLVTWDDRGQVTSQIKNIKVDAKLIKRLYMECVDRMNAYEEQVG